MAMFLALSVAMAVAILAVPGVVHAQPVIRVQGTIQAADCEAKTLTLSAADGAHVFPAASSTAVFVDSTEASFCTLQRYVGSQATVWVAASGDQLLAGRVDVSVAIAPVPQPVPGYGYGTYNEPYYGPYFYPFFDVGIGFDSGFGDRDFGRGRDFRHDGHFHRDGGFHQGDHGPGRGMDHGGPGGGSRGGFQGGGQGGGGRR